MSARGRYLGAPRGLPHRQHALNPSHGARCKSWPRCLCRRDVSIGSLVGQAPSRDEPRATSDNARPLERPLLLAVRAINRAREVAGAACAAAPARSPRALRPRILDSSLPGQTQQLERKVALAPTVRGLWTIMSINLSSPNSGSTTRPRLFDCFVALLWRNCPNSCQNLTAVGR